MEELREHLMREAATQEGLRWSQERPMQAGPQWSAEPQVW